MSLMIAVIVMLSVQTATVPASVPASPTSTPVHERCKPIDTSFQDWLTLGVYPDAGVTLSETWAVRSDDFAGVWFVASDLDGPELDGPDDIALWATSGLDDDGTHQDDGGGIVLSVNEVAHQFSDWPEATTIDDGPTDQDDGAEDVVECAKGEKD